MLSPSPNHSFSYFLAYSMKLFLSVLVTTIVISTGFPFFPPAESPSVGSSSPIYGPPLAFLPPALCTPVAPPPYSEATSSSYDRLSNGHPADALAAGGRLGA